MLILILVYIQGDQLNMAVFFWYLLKCDLCSARYSTRVHLINNFLHGTAEKSTAMFNWSPCSYFSQNANGWYSQVLILNQYYTNRKLVNEGNINKDVIQNITGYRRLTLPVFVLTSDCLYLSLQAVLIDTVGISWNKKKITRRELKLPAFE